ncbi:FxsA family protein [Natronosporangium hydrolyticum]|uniref:FxsA family protein n=1 Tax=Natronosporangium hydrolyticum TaxID=2811111 RepID=A0A895Y4N0_9ACTN|nr:FxsA family protein [Natronosporangium hydrolyticum]QSB12647.1 FxsA family protein [Natronosporangium hydrolyticum]
MSRRPWLPAALLCLLVAEIVTFLVIGNVLGFGWALLLVAAASLLGVVLLRREGLRAWRGFQAAAAEGAPPGPRVTDGVVGLTGAMLLTAPGLISGVAGAVLLLPPVRAVVRSRVQARSEQQMTSPAAGQMFGPRRVHVHQEPPAPGGDRVDHRDQVVEGEIVDDR